MKVPRLTLGLHILLMLYGCDTKRSNSFSDVTLKDRVSGDTITTCDFLSVLQTRSSGSVTQYKFSTDTIYGKIVSVEHTLIDETDTIVFGISSPDQSWETDQLRIKDIYLKAKRRKISLKTNTQEPQIFLDFDAVGEQEGLSFYPVIKIKGEKQDVRLFLLVPYGCAGTFCNETYILTLDYTSPVRAYIEPHQIFMPVVNFETIVSDKDPKSNPALMFASFKHYSKSDYAEFGIGMKIYKEHEWRNIKFPNYDTVWCKYDFNTDTAQFTFQSGDKMDVMKCKY